MIQWSQKEIGYRRFAAILSLSVGVILLLFKFWAYNMTGSEAIFSDAMESIVNVVAAALVVFVVSYAAKPVDRDHPYGHGKVEHFSAAFEGGLISFAAAIIIIEAIRALALESQLQKLDTGFYIVMGAGFVNFLLGRFLLYQGKKWHSSALIASAHHLFSDTLTSLGVGIGVILVHLLGWQWLDALIAIVVGGFLAYTGFRIVRRSIGALMDEEDLETLKSLAEVFAKSRFGGIIQIHHVKVIRSGKFHHIDAHIVVPEFWNVTEVHDHLKKFEIDVIKNYEFTGEMNFHTDPCRRVYCQNCDLKECLVRQEEFVKPLPVDLPQMRSTEEPEEFRIDSP